jgi:hypothetical protein
MPGRLVRLCGASGNGRIALGGVRATHERVLSPAAADAMGLAARPHNRQYWLRD